MKIFIIALCVIIIVYSVITLVKTLIDMFKGKGCSGCNGCNNNCSNCATKIECNSKDKNTLEDKNQNQKKLEG